MNFLNKLLSPKNLAQASKGMSKAQAIALDTHLMNIAKKGGQGSSLLKSYQGAKGFAPNLLSGNRGVDLPSVLAGLAGVSAGGVAGKPLALSLLNTAKNIDPLMAKGTAINSALALNPIYSAMKPGAAITTAPFSYAAKGIDALTGSGLAGMLAAHPVIAGLSATAATAMLAPKIARGAGNLLSRVGRQKRLNLLQKGIAPKSYRAIAQHHGFR